MTTKPNLIGLTNKELTRYNKLYSYYSDMNFIRGTPFPSLNKEINTKESSLEYLNLLELSLPNYQNILGKYTGSLDQKI